MFCKFKKKNKPWLYCCCIFILFGLNFIYLFFSNFWFLLAHDTHLYFFTPPLKSSAASRVHTLLWHGTFVELWFTVEKKSLKKSDIDHTWVRKTLFVPHLPAV